MSNTTNKRQDPQGTQTSAVLRNLIAAGLAKRLPQAVAADADKTTMLRALEASLGPAAVVDLGLDLRAWPDNPVFAAVTAASSAVGVLQRWFRLERFGHTRNRTRLLDHDGDSMTVCHVAIDGGSISAVNDLFVWGIILAVLERAGFRDLEASLIAPDGVRTPLYAGAAVVLPSPVPAKTETLWIRCGPRRHGPTDPVEALDGEETCTTLVTRLRERLASDLLEPRRLKDTARALGVSARQLQRVLRQEGTSFSETVQRTRIDHARHLMLDERLSLTEIAFCCGFADLAHCSRLFRRYLEVPPSVLRELLVRGGPPTSQPPSSSPAPAEARSPPEIT